MACDVTQPACRRLRRPPTGPVDPAGAGWRRCSGKSDLRTRTTAVPSDENKFLLRDHRCKEFTPEGPASLTKMHVSLLVPSGAAGPMRLGATGLGEAGLRWARSLVSRGSVLLPRDGSALEWTRPSRLRLLINPSARSVPDKWDLEEISGI